jgi:hypothetical protein
LLLVAFFFISATTADGDTMPLPITNAATPATCGEAIEVPLRVAIALAAVYQAEVMELPGAKMSRHFPKFEYGARASALSVAPTVIALATRAGE